MGAQPSTMRTRREHLERCARTLGVADPWTVTVEALESWWERQDWATETRRAHRSSQRLFWRWALERGHVAESPAALLPRVRPTEPNPHPATAEGYAQALRVADDDVKLMIRIAAEVGARRGEVAQVHSRDLIRDLTGWSIVLHGKGGRDRINPLPDRLAADLMARGPGWIFPGDDRGHLSPRWVGTLVARCLPDGYTMHSLRHMFAARLDELDGVDVLDIQELLGHASLDTTKRYVPRPRARLRDAVARASAA